MLVYLICCYDVVWQAFELRLWPHQHPLRQFEGILAQELLFKMEDRGLWMERLQVVLQLCTCIIYTLPTVVGFVLEAKAGVCMLSCIPGCQI